MYRSHMTGTSKVNEVQGTPHHSTVASLIPILSLHTEDTDGVSDTVNIFLFPELSIYTAFEA